MSVDSPELSRLETLPTEILHAVVGLLPVWKIKSLSCASKQLRQACLPIIFRRVKFKFSLSGMEELRAFLKSEVCGHVVSFTYEITELLKPGTHVHSLAGFTLMLIVNLSRDSRFQEF